VGLAVFAAISAAFCFCKYRKPSMITHNLVASLPMLVPQNQDFYALVFINFFLVIRICPGLFSVVIKSGIQA
jgi:hypothetical protein